MGLTAVTVLCIGHVDNPADKIVHVSDRLVVGSTAASAELQEDWTKKLKQVDCTVENGTTLIKTKPKPKPILEAAISRGGEMRTRMVSMKVPTVDTSFKSYMDYRTITNHASKQWKLQEKAHTNEEGFRVIDSDYLVALGTYYAASCGERFRVTLSSGKSFTVMVGDIKSNRDTNETKQYCVRSNGSGGMIEFIIDSKKLDSFALRMGDVSCLDLQGTVTSIDKIVP